MELFEKLKNAYLEGRLTKTSHQVSADRIAPFPEERIVDFLTLPTSNAEAGLAHLKKGGWARLVLNGGMATRFGGKVKGICEVFDGKTFLELKIEHMQGVEEALGIPEIPVALMNSPATHEATIKFLAQKKYFGREKLRTFVQEEFPRLTKEGTIFDAVEGKTSAPRGHGDFLWALKESDTFDAWKKLGVTHFDFSNIDNLGSTVDASLVGSFMSCGKSMGVEVVRKNLGDAGGAACMRDGVAGILEGIYFDPAFDQDTLPFFSPNNLMFQLEGLEALLNTSEFSLPWNVVHKNVEGHDVVQFERIAIDTVYAFNAKVSDDNVQFYVVPREGEKGRFYPVKSPDDLENLRDKLKQRLQQSITKE